MRDFIHTYLDPIFRKIYYEIDTADKQDGKPFDRPEMLQAHTESKYWGWTHFGVMIPDLPAPHYFFSLMSLIGATGSKAFDMNYRMGDSPRRTATAVCGTAATHPDHFGAYPFGDAQQGGFQAGSGLLQFGKDIVLRGDYPHYHLTAHIKEYKITIELANTDKVGWFMKNPLYEHISLLTKYSLVIEGPEGAEKANGICAFEYGACVSPYVLRDKPLPWVLKLPLDFFFYNIINIDSDTQLLLSYCTAMGFSGNRGLMVRGLNRYTKTCRNLDLEILEYHPQVKVSPDGIEMKVPKRWVWLAHENHEIILKLTMVQDTPFTYGLGNGYVGGCSYLGTFENRNISGRGYVEFIDVTSTYPAL